MRLFACAVLVPMLFPIVHPVALARAMTGQSESVVHVDNQSSAASDHNPGTASLPVKTVARGVRLAVDANGARVTVSIHPGVYRESVSVPEGGTGAAITIEASDVGKAVISGADIWTGWTRLGTTPVFAHEWPYRWGLAPIPRHWPPLEDIVRRREMVFVDGRLLRQVVGPTPLEEGTFFINEAHRMIYLWPSGGTDPNAATVEVAVRSTLFAASRRAHLTLSGLVFEHAATPVDDSAVVLDQMIDLLVQDTVFQWNNWGGLDVSTSTNVAAFRNVANYNGGRGMGAYKVRSVRYADNDTSYNNWRGAWGHLYGWAAAGIKALLVHGGTIRNHRAISNQAHGLWLDTDNENVTITDGVWCSNLTDGAFIEASQGPIAILQTTACLNGRAGVLIVASSNLTIRNSAFYGNGEAQVQVAGDPSDTVTNWETGDAVEVRAQNLTLCGNAVVGTSGGQDVLAIPAWSFLLASLRSARNTWWNPQNAAPFRLEGSTHLDLAGWRRVSRQDGDSVSADPRFADPANWNFTPLADGGWPRC